MLLVIKAYVRACMVCIRQHKTIHAQSYML
jgi:hypothetical protein